MIFIILFIIAAIVGGLLLHSIIMLERERLKPPPLWLYGMHEDGTPIEGWIKPKDR